MNKGFWRFSGVAGLLFVSCYWLGKKSSQISHVTTLAPVVSTAASSPKTAKTVADSKTVPQTESMTKKIPEQRPVALAWEKLRGGELYSVLFDQKTFSRLDSQGIEKLQAILFKPYPKLEAMYKAALLERLGVLKALEQQQSLRRAPSSVMLPELRGLYAQVLNNSQENWLVKRQAFKNLLPALSLQEKENYYRTLNSQVISLASKSEREIVEEVLREAR